MFSINQDTRTRLKSIGSLSIFQLMRWRPPVIIERLSIQHRLIQSLLCPKLCKVSLGMQGGLVQVEQSGFCIRCHWQMYALGQK